MMVWPITLATLGLALWRDTWSSKERFGQSEGVSYALAEPFRISSPFGKRMHPIDRTRKMHWGTDFATPVGTPVFAPEAGRVQRVDVAGIGKGVVNGNAVFLASLARRSGNKPKRLWAFLHLDEVLVEPGQIVGIASPLGRTGATGKATGPHLHLEVWEDGRRTDPTTVLAMLPSIPAAPAPAVKAQLASRSTAQVTVPRSISLEGESGSFTSGAVPVGRYDLVYRVDGQRYVLGREVIAAGRSYTGSINGNRLVWTVR